MKLLRRISILIAFLMIFSCLDVSAAGISGRGAIVVDYATGYVLYEKNADALFVPASMTKVMTLYVLFGEMEGKGLSAASEVTVSRRAANMSARANLSNVRLIEGRRYSVDSLISAVLTVSACGAALALGEAVSGNEADFVALMNDYAGRLGLTAHYTDCTGLSADNYITPRSMAELARRIITDYPQVLRYSSMTAVNWEGRELASINELLPGRAYAYPGADGLKTGHTNTAGYCLTATAVRNGRRLISVVFGCGTIDQRFIDTRALLDRGFEDVEKRAAEFYATQCRLDVPDSVVAGDEVVFRAELSGVATPSLQKGEWLINGVSVTGPCDAWVDNGSVSSVVCNLDGCEEDAVSVAFRLFNPVDSITFEKTVAVEHKYRPVSKAWAKIVFNGVPVDNGVKYPYIAYNGVTYMPLTVDNCLSMGFASSWSPEDGLTLESVGYEVSGAPAVREDCGPLKAVAAEGSVLSLNGSDIVCSAEYPILICNDVTYIPLTPETAAVFGLRLNYDGDSGTLCIYSAEE